ncbi:hypothetical protein CI238_09146 [Colletotrichum incanum]|uniref:Uncharacterized protein n=1 Tax=Colletotrichum incanum TaxID=1573173 RepID=A0A162NSZ8_COLIC|nr:hypothetical protein CI238_09146 [Colletotrichum incanum]
MELFRTRWDRALRYTNQTTLVPLDYWLGHYWPCLVRGSLSLGRIVTMRPKRAAQEECQMQRLEYTQG